MTPTYQCKHHHWLSWNHYGEKMWESGCKLKGGLFDCHYLDAKACPEFEQKGSEAMLKLPKDEHVVIEQDEED